MRRPLTRYITGLLLLYVLLGSLYIFGLFNLHLFTPEDLNGNTLAAGIKSKKVATDKYPNDLSNQDTDMVDELMLDSVFEDESPDISPNNDISLGASLKWKKTLLECSRIKKNLRTIQSQLSSQFKGKF